MVHIVSDLIHSQHHFINGELITTLWVQFARILYFNFTVEFNNLDLFLNIHLRVTTTVRKYLRVLSPGLTIAMRLKLQD